MPSPILIETFRVCLIGFGAVTAYGAYELLYAGGRAAGERAAVSHGLGAVALANAAASALLSIGLPAVLAA